MAIELTLSNFQSHSNTSLKLREGFACVVGPTNSGKSSIVRAVKWALYDSLRGTRHIRAGQETARVSLKFVDAEVERVKGKAGNRYRLNSTWYDAIGVGVPPEIDRATQIPLVQIDKDIQLELNVAMQMKSPFMVMETDSTKAKCLNVLTGGHILDAATRETNRRLRELEDQKKRTEEELAKSKVELFKFASLPDREARLNKVATDIERLTEMQKKQSKLVEIKQNLEKIRNLRAPMLLKAEKLGEKLADIERDLNRLEVLEEQLKQAEKVRKIKSQRIEVEHQKIQAVNELSKLEEQFLSLPEAICSNCGQLVSKDVREKHLAEIHK